MDISRISCLQPKFREQLITTATKLRVNPVSDFMITLQVSRRKANFRPYRHHFFGQIVNLFWKFEGSLVNS